MKRLALFVCLSALAAFGQGGAVTAVPTITNTRGEPVPYAKVAVCSANPGSAPATVCLGLFATISTDVTLGTPCASNVTPIGSISGTGCTNPGKSDGLGNVVAFAPAGQYWCEYFGGSISQPLVIPCFFASGGGGSAVVNCPSALNGSIAAFTSPTALSCDHNSGTDFAGNLFGQSWSSLGPVNGFVSLIGGGSAPGTQLTFKLPANTFRWLAPATVGTPYYVVPPSVRCSVGQVWGLASETTDGNGDKVDTYQCQTSVAAGTEVQVNGVDTTSQTPINFQNSSSVTFSNPSAGNITATASSTLVQIGTPVAPTLTTNGTPGGTSITYKIVGCEDGPTCAYHTPASATTTISTANATLSSSNSVNIKTYADTLYGPRCYNVYRTAAGGTPNTTGLIANCVWKSFVDTGLSGDGTTAPVTNTTTLDANGATAPLPGCAKTWAAPWGIDGPPCSPKALDDEFSYTLGIADTNDPLWVWQNQGSATATLTGGMVSLTTPATGADAIRCILQPVPATPYTFTSLVYPNISMQDGTTAPGTSVYGGMGWFESSTGKFEFFALQQQNNGAVDVRLIYTKWTNTTTLSSQVATQDVDGPSKPVSLRLQNDGTNLKAYSSNNGIIYQQGHTELLANFFTTAPNFVGLCVDIVSATSSSYSLDIDYWRQTQ